MKSTIVHFGVAISAKEGMREQESNAKWALDEVKQHDYGSI